MAVSYYITSQGIELKEEVAIFLSDSRNYGDANLF
jgi:hypothetical protein